MCCDKKWNKKEIGYGLSHCNIRHRKDLLISSPSSAGPYTLEIPTYVI